MIACKEKCPLSDTSLSLDYGFNNCFLKTSLWEEKSIYYTQIWFCIVAIPKRERGFLSKKTSTNLLKFYTVYPILEGFKSTVFMVWVRSMMMFTYLMRFLFVYFWCSLLSTSCFLRIFGLISIFSSSLFMSSCIFWALDVAIREGNEFFIYLLGNYFIMINILLK